MCCLINIEDLRQFVMRRLPRLVFDYIDGGAEREITLRENCRAFDQVLFRPRSAVATRSCDLRTSVLDDAPNLPFMLAPLGWIREAWQGRLVVKGMHIGDDARRAVDAGADAVSNHAARRLNGVARAIEILRTDIVRTLKLLGCASVHDLNASFVDVPAQWRAPGARP